MNVNMSRNLEAKQVAVQGNGSIDVLASSNASLFCFGDIIMFHLRIDCQLCGRSNIFAFEDEFHVVFHCEAYNDIRQVYIDKKVLSCANE